ncbi:hypothetical protein ADUPG1_002152, partial [Aduncisulcus paluster]
AKDIMFQYTDTEKSPWYVIESDFKRNARINCISHLLSQFDYEYTEPKKLKLPERQDETGYVRPPITDQKFVPDVATDLMEKMKKSGDDGHKKKSKKDKDKKKDK